LIKSQLGENRSEIEIEYLLILILSKINSMVDYNIYEVKTFKWNNHK